MEFTELTVWVSVGVGLFIFVPKEHQGYAFFCVPCEETLWGAFGGFLEKRPSRVERAGSPRRRNQSESVAGMRRNTHHSYRKEEDKGNRWEEISSLCSAGKE
jgi:hypothetical protein